MLDVFFVTFPFFFLVFAGYFAVSKGLLSVSAVPGLNSFVLYFALPCMCFRFGSETSVAKILDPVVFGVYLASALITVFVCIVITKRGQIGWSDASLGALVAAWPNTGFMGVPMLATLLGTASVGPVMLTMLIDVFVTSTLCVGLSRLDSSGLDSMGRAFRQALSRAASNPMPWAILFGILVSVFDLELWMPADKTINMLADAATPAALFTIGAMLARSKMNSTSRMPASYYLPGVMIKLFIHPLLLWSIGMHARFLGLSIDTFTLTTIVLLGALPSASNVSLLAERFKAVSGRIAQIILLTTTAAFFTFSVAVAIMT